VVSDRGSAARASGDCRPNGRGQPRFHQRGAVGSALGRSLTRSSRALRQVQERAQAVQPVGGKRGVGQALWRPGGRSQKHLSHDRFDHRARPPAGGDGPQKGGADRALGRSRGGLTTKIHLLADELGLPVDFLVTGGQVNDCTQAIELLGERRAEWVLADKGYDSHAIRDHIQAMGAVGSCLPNPTANNNESTTKNSIESAIASNDASPGSSTSAASPHDTKKSTKFQSTRRPRMLLATTAAICRYRLANPRAWENRSSCSASATALCWDKYSTTFAAPEWTSSFSFSALPQKPSGSSSLFLLSRG
jgi:hypothetical protein